MRRWAFSANGHGLGFRGAVFDRVGQKLLDLLYDLAALFIAHFGFPLLCYGGEGRRFVGAPRHRSIDGCEEHDGTDEGQKSDHPIAHLAVEQMAEPVADTFHGYPSSVSPNARRSISLKSLAAFSGVASKIQSKSITGPGTGTIFPLIIASRTPSSIFTWGL